MQPPINVLLTSCERVKEEKTLQQKKLKNRKVEVREKSGGCRGKREMEGQGEARGGGWGVGSLHGVIVDEIVQ